MRLVCPNCDAKYEVPDDAIPDGGRDVQCANCGHAWFQAKSDPDEVEALAAASARYDAARADVERDDDGGGHADATAEVSPPVAAETSPLRQGIDDSVLAILREEAEREADARLSDPRPVATAAKAAIESAAGLTPTQRRMAMLHGDETAQSSGKPAARRDLLPDVEEINSTLQPSDQGIDPDAEIDSLPDLTQSRSGFRSGFLMMMTISIMGLAAYIAAPQLSERIPGLAGPLDTYVQFVNLMRQQLDGLMQSATSAINGNGG